MSFGSIKQDGGNLNCLADIWRLWWAQIIINNERSTSQCYSLHSPLSIEALLSLLSLDSYLLSFCLLCSKEKQTISHHMQSQEKNK